MKYINTLLGVLPFHGHILMQLRIHETNEVKTAAIARKGRKLVAVFNPEFMAGLGPKGQWFVAAHEAEHVARFHVWRRGERDPVLWNIACDMLINTALKRFGLELPPDTRTYTLNDITDGKRRQKLVQQSRESHAMFIPLDQTVLDMTEEQIYEKLIDAMPEGGAALAGQAMTMDDHEDGNGGGSGEGDAGDEAVARTADAIIVAGAVAATPERLRGTIPGHTLREVEALENYRSKVGWRQRLARFIGGGRAREDFSYASPNIAALARDPSIIVPGVIRYGVGKVAVIVDTSASMGGEELTVAMSELKRLMREAGPEEVIFIEADADVGRVTKVQPHEMDTWQVPKLTGGGGTTFGPALQEAMKHDPRMVIYFTDGYGDDPDPLPVPTLWCVIGSEHLSASWGEVVHVDGLR